MSARPVLRPTADIKGIKRPSEPIANGSEPKQPKGLDKYAREEWKDFTTKLREMGLLSNTDGKSIEIHCRLYAMWKHCCDGIEKDGMFLTHPTTGSTYANPATSYEISYRKELNKSYAAFGMTPIGRAKLGIANSKPKTADPILKCIS